MYDSIDYIQADYRPTYTYLHKYFFCKRSLQHRIYSDLAIVTRYMVIHLFICTKKIRSDGKQSYMIVLIIFRLITDQHMMRLKLDDATHAAVINYLLQNSENLEDTVFGKLKTIIYHQLPELRGE